MLVHFKKIQKTDVTKKKDIADEWNELMIGSKRLKMEHWLDACTATLGKARC
jgi:hypothetical protein